RLRWCHGGSSYDAPCAYLDCSVGSTWRRTGKKLGADAKTARTNPGSHAVSAQAETPAVYPYPGIACWGWFARAAPQPFTWRSKAPCSIAYYGRRADTLPQR